jgi:glycosyltransferase involved in cell wall biosynthesis
LRIAYLTPTGALGGAEFCLLDLLSSARSLFPEWEPHVLLGSDGKLRGEVEALGIPCDVLPLPAKVAKLGDAGLQQVSRFQKSLRLGFGGLRASADTLAYANRLSKWLRFVDPDVVQTNGMKMHLLGAWSARKGLPVVWHLHDYLGSRPAMARLLKLSRRPRLTAVAVSCSVAVDAMAVLGCKVPVHAILNRIDLERFHDGPGDGAKLDRAGGVEPAAPGTVRVGLVATFAIWKGHSVFLEAISKIPANRQARFYIVGGPIYESLGSQITFESLRDQAAALGISDRLVLTGHQEDPAEAIRSLDVVVHASTRPEPFGRVIAEGMACGRAVIAMRDGGAAELFVDESDALGCDPGNPEQLAQIIDRLILDQGLRDRLGREGRRSALKRFDRTRLAEDWARIYLSTENDKGTSPSHRPETEPASSRN